MLVKGATGHDVMPLPRQHHISVLLNLLYSDTKVAAVWFKSDAGKADYVIKIQIKQINTSTEM